MDWTRGLVTAVLAAIPTVGAVAWPEAAHGAGRWYAYLDRVPAARAAPTAAEWRRRGVPATSLPSERIFGVEPGFAYLVAFESLYQSEAQAYVDRLEGGGFRGTGVQYFTDALPAGVAVLLGSEPVFAVEADIDGAGPAEVVALTRGDAGDVLHIITRHVDGTESIAATHPVRLFDLPRTTEGERARVFPIGGGLPGIAVVFEAAFVTANQAAAWHIAFTFTREDRRAPPGIHFVPSAVRPLPTTVSWGPARSGALGYEVRIDGLRGGSQRRAYVWQGDRFVDARIGTPTTP
jgi:hypothetical protein